MRKVSSYLEVRLPEDARQLGGALVSAPQLFDVPQDLADQLHVVVLHRLEPHLVQRLLALGLKAD